VVGNVKVLQARSIVLLMRAVGFDPRKFRDAGASAIAWRGSADRWGFTGWSVACLLRLVGAQEVFLVACLPAGS